MNRYLGSKTKILPDILRVIEGIKPRATVCDIFAGSLAVSLLLKRLGHRVIANDINPLSYAYGRAYLTATEIPQFEISQLFRAMPSARFSELRRASAKIVEQQRDIFDKGNTYGEFKSWAEYASSIESLSMVLSFMALEENQGRTRIRRDIYDHYTKGGRKSRFISSRGLHGNRNFFNSSNAKSIDFFLSTLRAWNLRGVIGESEKFSLLSVLLDSMERCVNTQGTYHDFPRKTLEARARKNFKIQFPDFFGLLHNKKRHVMGCGDSLEFIRDAPRHDVLYIDPPYNFRQYTAYYHLPNFFVRYVDLPDLDGYLDKLSYVRGQNMEDDFSSPFSSRRTFLPALADLVSRAKCGHVVLSYFDGVNHWNRFLKPDNSDGFQRIREFFDSDLFEAGSLKVVPVSRMNYQSQNGHNGKAVTEFIFVAQRAQKLP